MTISVIPILVISGLGFLGTLGIVVGVPNVFLFGLGLRQATAHLYPRQGDGLLSSTTPILPRIFHLEDVEGPLDPKELTKQMKLGRALFLKKELKIAHLTYKAGEPIDELLAAALVQLGWTVEASSPLFFNLEWLRPVVPEMPRTDKPWQLTQAEVYRLRSALLPVVRLEFDGWDRETLQKKGLYGPVIDTVREFNRAVF